MRAALLVHLLAVLQSFTCCYREFAGQLHKRLQNNSSKRKMKL
jgi:hypothetical protein